MILDIIVILATLFNLIHLLIDVFFLVGERQIRRSELAYFNGVIRSWRDGND